MTVPFLIITLLMAICNIPSVYTCVSVLFTFKKRRPYPSAAPKTRFAVVIPARNEEGVIANIIGALNRQDYPRELFDIHVILNNCADSTGEIARSLGAKTYTCTGKITRKGDALHEGIAHLRPMGYDAYAVFDADNIPDPAFLRRMNDAMRAGERVCKGRLKGGNPTDSWVAGGYAIYHSLLEWCYSRPHSAMGFSSNLVGTGFAVHSEVIEKLGGWNTVTICEDTELLAQAAILGYRVAWVYEALSYDEQVADLGVSMRQRLRWTRGMVEVARRYTGRLLSKDCPKKGVARDLVALFAVSHTAPMSMPLMLIAFCLQPPMMKLLSLLSLPASYIGLALAAWFFAWLGGYDLKKIRKAILMFPIFMLTWMPLQFFGLFIPVKEWPPVKHYGQADVSVNK